MSTRAFWIVIAVCLSLRGDAVNASAQSEQQLVLAVGQSGSLLDTGLTVTFEAVVSDSRCPTGVNCVWEGDAEVRVRIDATNVKPSTYTLHTSERSPRQISHGDVEVGLVSLVPHPTTDGPPRAADYRATLSVRRKSD